MSSNFLGKIKQVPDADVEHIESFLGHQLPDFIGTLVMLLVLFITMFLLNVWLAFVKILPVRLHIMMAFLCLMEE